MATTYDEINTDTGQRTPRKAFGVDDLAVWPDGTWATLGDVWAGQFAWMSDDYETIDQNNTPRLAELGVSRD